MKQQVATNLLGKKVKITMGLTDEAISNYPPTPTTVSHECWRRLGQDGTVTSVYIKEGELMLLLSMEPDGALFEMFASHCRMMP